MNKLEDFVNNYNLCTTNTCDNISAYLDRVIEKDYSLNLEDSINLQTIVKTFVKNYQGFKDDYNKLPKLNLCEYEDILRYEENIKYNIQTLDINLYNLFNDYEGSKDVRLLLYSNDEGYFAKLIKDFSCQKYVDIDKNIIKTYLEFGHKYKDLIDAYHELRNNMLFGNGTMTMYFTFYDRIQKGNNITIIPKLIQEIDKLNIGIGMLTFDSESYFDLTFDLNDNGDTIIVNKSIIENNNYQISGSDLDYIVENIYLNKEYLPSIYNQENVKKLEKRK